MKPPATSPRLPRDLLDHDGLQEASDGDLSDALTAITAEITSRALARADAPALIEDGFARGFNRDGMPEDPWLVAGILVCPGAKVEASAMRHKCAFVRIDEQWVWEADGRLEDTVRHLPGPHPVMRSVTLVAVPPGTSVDLVSARTRQGVHELVGVRSFGVTQSGLELVSARAVKAVSHRPGS